MTRMRRAARIVVHDFGGFAFPAQLGRELAKRGHAVKMLYSDLDIRGGRLLPRDDDPDGFSIAPVSTGRAFHKYAVLRRANQEFAYARSLLREIAAFRPDYVFNTNAPMIVSWRVRRCAAGLGYAYVHWTQDIHTHTIGYVLENRLGRFGRLGRQIVRSVERDVMAKAAGVIVIADEFETELARLGIHSRAIYTIPNWMPTDEIMPAPKDNEFSRAFGLTRSFNVMYTGMLGHKHEIEPFVAMAESCRDLHDFRVVVVGRGFGFDRLRRIQADRGLANLILIDWQEHERLPRVLAAADILMAVITPDASASSVPSKILTYLCAGRAVLAALPEGNLGRRLVEHSGTGVAVHPRDHAAIIALVRHLHHNPAELAEYGSRARRYAEETFDIRRIADRFETVMAAVGPHDAPAHAGPVPRKLAELP